MSDFEKKIEAGVHLRAELGKYLRYWYWFFISVIVCLFLAFLYLRYVTPIYRVSASVLVRDDRKGGDVGNVANFVDMGGLFKTKGNVNNEVEILKSKTLITKVVSSLPMLQTTILLKGNVRHTEIYNDSSLLLVDVLKVDTSLKKVEDRFCNIEVQENGQVKVAHASQTIVRKSGDIVSFPALAFKITLGKNAVSGTSFSIFFNDVQQVAAYYNTAIEVAPKSKDVSILDISLNDRCVAKAEDILNRLVEQYSQDGIDDKNLISKNTVEFIEKRLVSLVSELSKVENEVAQYKLSSGFADPIGDVERFSLQASDFYKQQEEAKIKENVILEIQKYMNAGKESIVPSSLGINDPTLLSLVQSYNEAQLEKSHLLSTEKESSVLVQNINRTINDIKIRINENLRNIQKSAEIAKENVEKNYQQFQYQVKYVPEVERKLLAIKREQSIKDATYKYLLQKQEEARLALAATVSNLRVIDKAYSSFIPIKPKKNWILIGAIVVALLIPFLIIYILELIDNKVRNRKDVTDRVSIPILGELIHDEEAKYRDLDLVVTEKSRTPIAELFRLVRTNLQFANIDKNVQTLIATSSISGDGKTFVCINLGASIALTGKKVVLIELDIRKPKLIKGLGMKSTIGISNFVLDHSLTVDDLVLPVENMPNLSVIACGPIPPNPSELLLSSRFELLFAELKSKFDYIIIDMSPVGQVSDVFTMKKYIDACLYVIRYNHTLKEYVNILADIYENKKMDNLMVILNDAKKQNIYGYGGYGYGYGYGYGTEKKYRSLWYRLKKNNQ